jgi:hypothetical protein
MNWNTVLKAVGIGLMVAVLNITAFALISQITVRVTSGFIFPNIEIQPFGVMISPLLFGLSLLPMLKILPIKPSVFLIISYVSCVIAFIQMLAMLMIVASLDLVNLLAVSSNGTDALVFIIALVLCLGGILSIGISLAFIAFTPYSTIRTQSIFIFFGFMGGWLVVWRLLCVVVPNISIGIYPLTWIMMAYLLIWLIERDQRVEQQRADRLQAGF